MTNSYPLAYSKYSINSYLKRGLLGYFTLEGSYQRFTWFYCAPR